MEKQDTTYSYKNMEFWCHKCMKEFKQLKLQNEVAEVYCRNCGSISEEIDPRDFYGIPKQQSQQQNQARNTQQQTQQIPYNIYVESLEPNGVYRLTIISSGPGIQVQQQQTIFSPFGLPPFLMLQNGMPPLSQNRQPTQNNQQQQQYSGNRSNIEDLFSDPFYQPTFVRGFLPEAFEILRAGPALRVTHPLFNFMNPLNYQNIIQEFLRHFPNSKGPPPASQSKINSLKSFQVTESNSSNFKDCTVCQEDFKVGDNGLTLPCRHNYHKDCIVTWLNLHDTCPVCREKL